MVVRCYIAAHVDMKLYTTQNYWLHVMHKNYRREDEIEIAQRESAVGIANCYGVEGSGSESRWREIFRAQRK